MTDVAPHTIYTKTWFEDGRIIKQVIPQAEIYKSEWVGLTREEMFECGGGMLNSDEERLCRYVEAKLKEKNT